MAFDNFFKELMRDFLSGCDVKFDDAVGILPLKIDLVVKCPGKTLEPFPIPLLETHFSPINLFEYKSSHDAPKKQDLSKLVGYLGLYCDQHGIGIEEMRSKMAIWYISAKWPSFFDKLLKDNIISKTDTHGLYQLNFPFFCSYYLMVINELDVIEENLPLLLLSSDDTLKNTIRLIAPKRIKPGSTLEKYLSSAILKNYEEVHTMTELQSLLPEHVKRNIKLAIEDIGLKEVIQLIGVEEVLKAMRPEEVLKAMGPEEVVKMLGIKKTEQILKKLKAKSK